MEMDQQSVIDAIRRSNQQTFGSDEDLFVPTFPTEAHLARFVALKLKVTAQHETRNGVSWVGKLKDGSVVITVEQDGRGGGNFYDAPMGQREALNDLQRFAAALFPNAQAEQLDLVIMALEPLGLVTA